MSEDQLQLSVPREMSFVVPGEVRGKGRPKTRVVHTPTGGAFANVYTDAKTKKYEMHVAQSAMTAKGKQGWAMVTQEEPLRVDVIAYFYIPKSRSKKQRAALDGRPAMNRIDADNVVKSLLDGVQGVLFLDDKIVTTITCKKVWVAEEKDQGLHVRVATCG